MSVVVDKEQGKFFGPLATNVSAALRNLVRKMGSRTATSSDGALDSVKRPDETIYESFKKKLNHSDIREKWYSIFSKGEGVRDAHALDNLRWFFKELVRAAKDDVETLGYASLADFEAKDVYARIFGGKIIKLGGPSIEEIPEDILVVPIMAGGLDVGAGVFAALEDLGKKPKYALMSYSHVRGRKIAENKIYIPKADLEILKRHRGPILLVDDWERSGLTINVIETFMRDLWKRDLYKFVDYKLDRVGDSDSKKAILSKILYRRALRT